MSQVTQLQNSLHAARKNVTQAEHALALKGGERAQVERALEGHLRSGDTAGAAAARQQLAQLESAMSAASQQVEQMKNAVDGLFKELSLDPATLIAQLDSTYPVALLPVRIETRYFGVGQANPELCIRIYPDDIHVDAHEPELTETEEKWGRAYWEAAWRAADDAVRAKKVWSILVDQAGPQRAAWVALRTAPTNSSDSPGKPLGENDPLPVAPMFPAPELKGADWTRAAVARMLPDRWHAIGYRGGAQVFAAWGNPVPDVLAVSHSPGSIEPPAGELPLDEGMRWMVDFDRAVEVGMGIRIPYAGNADLSLDQLLVIGVKTSASPENAAEMLSDTLDAHHYTGGLAIVPQGTPTNNSSEQSSGFASRESDAAASYEAERAAPLFSTGDGSNGDRLTSFLGVRRAAGATAPEVFAHIRHAGGSENPDARHMNTALWPATWGYYLRVMLEGVVTDEGRDRLRRHFIDYVHGRGPLSALRVNRQPYGVLPALSLDLWEAVSPARDPFESHLLGMLRKLRNFWRNSLPGVPRIGHTGDIDQDLVATLGMDATSLHYATRNVDGKEYSNAVWSFLDVALDDDWWEALENASFGPLLQLGIQEQPPLSRAVHNSKETELTSPLVTSAYLSESSPLQPNYIEELLKQDMFTLKDGVEPKARPAALLYLLLRHSLLLAYTTAATKIAKDNGVISAQLASEPVFVGIDPAVMTTTVWDVMAQPVPVVSNQQPIGEYLATTATANLFANFDTVQIGELRASLEYLSKRPSAVLERLLTETLDLSVHRLDAWITSLATVRLEARRQSQPRGVYLGGYGYVEHLKPDAPRVPIQKPPAGEAGSPIYETDAPAGFIHAPSLTHAATAAVLRSGNLSHTGAAGNLLAVDLSSERVRMAQWFLDGVRQGQPLAALLGYRFERGLHENHAGLQLDEYIAPLRRLAPLVAGKLEPINEANDESVESVAARNVVDGVKLHRLWKESGIAWGSDGLPASGAKKDAILAELLALDAALDAVSDAVVAESVHQAVQGNLLRAGAALDAVSAGDVPPPELEVARTPRSGIGLTHRLLALLPPNLAPPANWPVQTAHVRASAEPSLNAWAAKLLGDPARVKVRVQYLNPQTKALEAEKYFALSELNLAPLDLLYTNEGAPGAPFGDIEQRFRYHADRERPPEVQTSSATLELTTERIAALSATDLALAEFLPVVKAARDLFLQSRPLQASDLALPNDQTPPGLDLADLAERADAVRDALGNRIDALAAVLASGPLPDADALRDALLPFTHFGFDGALPMTARGLDVKVTDALILQSQAILKEAGTRANRIMQLESGFDANSDANSDANAARDYHVARIRAALGDSFRVLPRFNPANGAELAQTFGDTATLLEGDTSAPLLWFSRASRVRAGVARLDAAMRYVELLDTGETLSLSVGQLPAGMSERWVGLKSDKPVLGGRVSLVAHSVGAVDPNASFCGLLVDDWTEVIPNKTEMTGVVFQHDAPGARAPHAVLLAVAPGFGPNWSLPALEATVLETLELAQLRAVDADSLAGLGQYLPGLYFAFNVANDTVSADFISLKDFSAGDKP